MRRCCRLGLFLLAGPAVWAEVAAPAPDRPPPPLDGAAILRELTDFTRAGRDRRLGPDYAYYHTDAAAEKFPEVWMPPVKEEVPGRRYEIGGPWTKRGGDFSSTQGQILYAANAGFGLDRVTLLEWSNGCFSEKPEPPWNCASRPEPTLPLWQAAAGHDPGAPIAMARGMAGWANCGVIVFASGLVATAGTVTGHGSNPIFQFPRNKLPTAISVTNKNEFALITVIDTDRMTGQVAVLALTSSGKENAFWHEWRDGHPGLPNVAVFTHLKLLGYIDLPGINFPTAISAVGNATTPRLNGRDGNAGMLSAFNLAEQSDRDIFNTGYNADYSSRCGYAVVLGRYEGRAAFLDLKPLFLRLREMYYTTEEKYRRTLAQGDGPGEWPYAFAADPSWAPTVAAVIDRPEPVAVLASLGGGIYARTFIASRDGSIGIYRVGGLATAVPATASAIQLAGTVQVGRNPICLAYDKNREFTVIAVSRGDREIAWIRYTAEGGQVVQRLRDARLLDPVFVEVADTHGVRASLLTVADFKGRKIVNYRYSEVVFATQGGAHYGLGARGRDEFECGGQLDFPGWPFALSAANVN